MSEDDRAAKAARAKALLKKRQKKAAAGSSGVGAAETGSNAPTSGVSSPISPSRTFSPAPGDELVQEDKRDISDIFSKVDTNDSWLASLPRPATPPTRTGTPQTGRGITSPPPPPSANGNGVNGAEVDALKKEKERLSGEVKRLGNFESETKQIKEELEKERASKKKLDDEVKRLGKFEFESKQIKDELEKERASKKKLDDEVKRLGKFESESKQIKEELEKERALKKKLDDEVKRLGKFESELKQVKQDLAKEGTSLKELQERYDQLEADTETTLENERQTVSLLVSEKASLTKELGRLEDLESQAQNTQNLLDEERENSKALQEQVHNLESEVAAASKRAGQAEANEKELTERVREQERQLQIANAAASDARTEADNIKRKLRELEEQIQTDDRVEVLELSLKNTQDRADELEFQLSKLKQSQTALKAERDEFKAQIDSLEKAEKEWERKCGDLQKQQSSLEEQLAAEKSEKEKLSGSSSGLRSEIDSAQAAIAELQQKLQQAASEMASQSHQLQTAQNELKKSQRRAEDAESIQKVLQDEGATLMQSLDEMRPKIVELTDAKLELAEKIQGLEHNLRSRDGVIAQLESTVEELREKHEQSEKMLREALAQRDREQSDAHSNTSELQKAYVDLQDELESALAGVKNMEAERTHLRQEASRRMEEIDAITARAHSQEEELSKLQEELESRKNDHEEEQDFLERAQNDIEILRAEIAAKDEEIERLHELASSPPSRSGEPQSLDGEMLSSLRQQHALDLSAAQSQIRALEDSVFNAEAKSHSLQKRINILEDQLTQARPPSRLGQRSFSPGPSRPSSRAQKESDLRRASFGSRRPDSTLPPALSRSVYGQDLSPETSHKRKVSLSMLKARIDSETTVISYPSSRALSPVQSTSSHDDTASHASHVRRPKFLDDSHVFWCHSCHGDLVIL